MPLTQWPIHGGWYGLFVVMLVSDLIVLGLGPHCDACFDRRDELALCAFRFVDGREEPERENRLMSMDAVAAAISHEVGQPLNAAVLNATAGLDWLTRSKPDLEKAIKALRASIDDDQRTFDVIKSIRATFAKGPGCSDSIQPQRPGTRDRVVAGQGAGGRKGFPGTRAG